MMPPVSDRVLSWLFNVLQPYQNRQRAYADAVRVLQTFSSLNPRTEVYTYDSGSSALLLTFSGTLPVGFRGITYHFPVRIWVPQEYPHQPPMAYVLPDEDVQIRAGQHVSVDGRVYHPYLREWSNMWDRASIADFLEYLQQAFAKEPPVVSKTTQTSYHDRPPERSSSQSSQTAAPALPPKQHVERSSSLNTAPPRPPKPGDRSSWSKTDRDVARDGPPLPPLPQGLSDRRFPGTSSPSQPYARQIADSYNSQPAYDPSPALQQHHGQFEQPHPRWVQHLPAEAALAGARVYSPNASQHRSVEASSYQIDSRTHQRQPLPTMQPAQSQVHTTSSHSNELQKNQRPSAPASSQQNKPQVDLLSDPFDIALPPTTTVRAPPIPPNPEKEHLIQALSAICAQQAQQMVDQNSSAMVPLQAQQHALQTAYTRLEAELAQLQALDAVLASNEAILHRNIRDCDRAIADAKSNKQQPPIDDVLIAPTVIARQLWSACADEAACREAMYALQNAVDKGRISGVDFVRQMRGLGRECFLKMTLARKCARGLGLDIGQSSQDGVG